MTYGHLSIWFDTQMTVRHCDRLRKPVLVLDGDTLKPEEIAATTNEFVMTNKIATLNVAGPRECSHNGASEYSRQVVARLIALVSHTA